MTNIVFSSYCNMDTITSPLPLTQWRWIVINSSGGKDSQTALHQVAMMASLFGINDRIVVAHQCLGEMEWPGTKDLAESQAKSYGFRFEVSSYRDRKGDNLELLEYARRRGKWPDNQNRWCTSEFKRGPGGRVITMLWRESPGPILNVFGFRAEESPARVRKKEFAYNSRFSTESRQVFDWLPIHDMKESEVWDSIKRTGVPSHPAYKLGMPRLSCMFCIFAPKAALMIAGRANPELLDRYVQVEREIGHNFQHKKPIADIQRAIQAGEQVGKMDGQWNM